VANNDYGVWLAEVFDGLALASTAVIGVSWGGFAAIRLAAHAPDRITKLAADTSGRPRLTRPPSFGAMGG
jgi:2-hydroxy-6-oxonona-2,4-dienedioate hydrolase